MRTPLVMAAALLAVRMALVPHAGRHVPMAALGALVAVGLSAYGGLAQALGLVDVNKLVAGGMRRFRRA